MSQLQLPLWREEPSNGDYMVVGTRLHTRDGRQVGNSVVEAIVQKNKTDLAIVLTDTGRRFKMNVNELMTYFHKPTIIVSKRVYMEEHRK
jgi:hypothetical protein